MIFPVILLSLGGLVGSVDAQAYEPADFNVTTALEELGIDVSQLPPLSDLSRRGDTGLCSAAVSSAHPPCAIAA
jgi:hypothetical protein